MCRARLHWQVCRVTVYDDILQLPTLANDIGVAADIGRGILLGRFCEITVDVQCGNPAQGTMTGCMLDTIIFVASESCLRFDWNTSLLVLSNDYRL